MRMFIRKLQFRATKVFSVKPGMRWLPLLLILSISVLGLIPFWGTRVRAAGGIEFIDSRTVTVNFAWLQQHQGRLEIQIKNDDTQPQEITLRLVGLELLTAASDPALTQLAAVQPATIALDPNKTGTFVLVFDVTKSPINGDYQGILVAESATTGAIARCNFDLQVNNYSSQVFAPDRIDTLILKGTDYLPSVWSQMGPFLFFAGLILFLLGICLVIPSFTLWKNNWATPLKWEEESANHAENIGENQPAATSNPKEAANQPLREAKSHKRKLKITEFFAVDIILVVGFVCLVLGFLALRGNIPNWNLSHVVVNPVKVASSQSQPIGEVSDTGGALGTITQTGNKLKVTDIQHAGQYTGKITLQEKSNINTTVLVSDWWVWAFLTISMGVLVGYYIAWYYGRKRVKEKIDGDSTELQQVIIDSLEKLKNGCDAELKTSLDQSALAVKKWFEKLQDDPNIETSDDANKRLTITKDYFNSFKECFKMRTELSAAKSELEKPVTVLKTNLNFNEDLNSIVVFNDINKILDSKELSEFLPEYNRSDFKAENDYLAILRNTIKTQLNNVKDLTNVLAVAIENWDKFSEIKDNREPSDPFYQFKQKILNVLNSSTSDVQKSVSALWESIDGLFARLPQKGRVKMEAELFRTPLSISIEEAIITTREKTETAKQKRLRLKIHDTEFAFIVGLLAVGSGFGTLYFKTTYWGSTLDYLTAFLWGAIGSQGLKYVVDIINKFIPTG